MKVALTLAETSPTPIERGDAGIILKQDGSFQLFNADPDFDPESMTDRQREQGEQLFALSLPLKIPALMHVLVQMANDPAIVSGAIDRGIAH